MKNITSMLVFLIVVLTSCAQPAEQSTVLNVEEYNRSIEGKDVQLIDVRTAEEYNEGYIGEAVNIDYLSNDFEEKIQKLDKDKPVYIYCKSGNRSGKAAQVFKENGFTEIYDLEGGITAWEEQKQ